MMFIVVIVSFVELIGVYFVLGDLMNCCLIEKDLLKGYCVEGLVVLLGGIFNVFFYMVFF